jgi:amino acid transporter
MAKRTLPRAGVKKRAIRARHQLSRYFRLLRPGILEATDAAYEPADRLERALIHLRRLLFGPPIPSVAERRERLPKRLALPVFGSDAMSSVAYAPQASMYTLLAAGVSALALAVPISLAIVALLLIVTISYRQTIRAYPNGGGSYIVARSNLGPIPGLVAAAALLSDYVLTVSVSMSSGVYNLASAFPALLRLSLPLIVAGIVLITYVNLRGLRQSGRIFAGPTYLFLGSVFLMIAVGLARTALGQPPQVTDVLPAPVAPEPLIAFLLLRAFAEGCSAMTGVEAISNGTPAFEPPEAANARTTLAWMAMFLGTMLLGITVLATISGAIPSDSESILSQIGRATFGTSPMYYLLQLSALGILVLAAQTSFADFPRLSSFLARDRYFPRQFSYRGERLVFNNGILALAVISIIVVLTFGGRVEALIPLYALGAFTAFTLSQSGMVRHWLRDREPGWKGSAVLNGAGAIATGTVTIVFAIAKFGQGAWIVIVLVPLLVTLMLAIRAEYVREERASSVSPQIVIHPPRGPVQIIIPVIELDRAVAEAVRVAGLMIGRVQVVHIASDLDSGEQFRRRAQEHLVDVEVVVIDSPYRDLVQPLVHYLEALQAERPRQPLVVLLPVHVPRHWSSRFLFNDDMGRIRAEILGRRGLVVLELPYLQTV